MGSSLFEMAFFLTYAQLIGEGFVAQWRSANKKRHANRY
jgi:hypothetical protein